MVEKIKKNYKVLVPILIIILVLVICIFIFSDYKYKNKREVKELEVYQYFTSDKLEYTASVMYNRNNKILSIVPKGITIEYDSTPIYYKDDTKVIFPSDMVVVFPLKDVREYKLDKYSTYTYSDNMNYLNVNGIDMEYSYFFLHDAGDVYFFPYSVDVYIDDVYYKHLGSMSYLNTSGGYNLITYDKETDKYDIIDIENKVVTVKNDIFDINVSFDYMTVYSRDIMLASNTNNLKVLGN